MGPPRPTISDSLRTGLSYDVCLGSRVDADRGCCNTGSAPRAVDLLSQYWRRSNGASLNEFLERLGFAADPFESTNAEDESLLADYFVPPPYFASVQGDPKNPAPHIVFAPRGSGKTAQRRMIEVESQRAGSYICVTYASFDQPPGFRVEDADLNYHLNQICRLILIGVLFYLEENADAAEQLTPAQRGVLKLQVERFLGTLSVAEFSNAMRSIKSLGDKAADLWQKYGDPSPWHFNS